MALHLVRHGRPLVRPEVSAHERELDPAGFDDVWALRESGRLPARATWFCAPEPVVVATAQLLTEQDVGILEELREVAGESLAACRDRVVPAVRRVLDVHLDEDVVLIGHATAWALVAAAVSDTALDLDRWRRLSHPGVVVLPL